MDYWSIILIASFDYVTTVDNVNVYSYIAIAIQRFSIS